MIGLKRILLPSDFSECSHKARAFALELAEQFDADLHLLHVIKESARLPEFGMGLSFPTYSTHGSERMAKLESHAIERLTEMVPEGWSAEHSVTIAVRVGHPFVEILTYGRAHDIDLIVMGTHGHGAVAHTLLGSVAERVVAKSPCPVLTVKPEDHLFVMP